VAWLLAGVWKLKGIRKEADKGKYSLGLSEEDIKHILPDCTETRNWRKVC
jgi:hypothetical protein